MTPASGQPLPLRRGARRAVVSLLVSSAAFAILPRPVRISAAESGSAWRSLPLITNGKVDANWVQIGWGGFVVEDGSLRTNPDPRGLGLLVYQRERFGNCQLRVVFKAKTAKANAGVYVRLADGILAQLGHPGAAFERGAANKVSQPSMDQVKISAEREEGPWYAVHRGYEVQIMDSADPLHRTGAIYSLAPSTAEPNPGEWRTMIITLEGERIMVELDGKRITNFDPTSADIPPRKNWPEPKREPTRPESGYLGLQNHDPGEIVWFKEVSVRAQSGSRVGAALFTAQGSMAGEVTATRALLQTRLTAIPGPSLDSNGDVPGSEGVVSFEYGTKSDFSDARRTEWMRAGAAHDFIVRAALTNLHPGQLYHYRPIFGANEATAKPGATCRFSTLPGKESDRAVTFIVGSCMNYMKFLHGAKGKAGPVVTATEEDKRLGYRSFVAMAALKPDFFVGTGDIVYYDNILHGPARTLPDLRECWHEQFRFPRLVEFFSRTPAYWSKDDHDFRFNESDNETPNLPLPQTGIELFREQMPILAAGDRASPTYRTHRVNRHLQIWLTEGRDHRSPNAMPDGPDKSLWGEEQRAWLRRTLKESDATWKILISPTPMVGPDDATKIDNHADLGGFRHEADAFFRWLQENKISGFMTVCGDRHWQYHSIHPSGVEEFACGALNDENARLGVPPGSKKGTDPEGRIKQPYLYSEPTGGFLHVRVASETGTAKLMIEHRDDTGKVMNAVTKTAPRSLK